MDWKDYKQKLILQILEWQKIANFTHEELNRMSIRSLELIHDNVK